MNREELIQILRDNLTIDTRENRGYYGDTSIAVQLKLDDDVISETYFYLPRECSHDDRYK